MKVPDLALAFAEVQVADRFHVGALISRQTGLLEMVSGDWSALRNDAGA